MSQIKIVETDEYYCPACGSENLCCHKIVEDGKYDILDIHKEAFQLR